MAARFPLQALALAISTSFLLTACSDGDESKAPEAAAPAAESAPAEAPAAPAADADASAVAPEAVLVHGPK